MHKKTRWPWKVYFFISTYMGIINFMGLLAGDSQIDQYYKILIVFKRSYLIWYGFNIASISTEALCLIPLFLFVFHKRFLSPFVWQSLFGIRIVLFFLGHSYEVKMIKSYFYANSAVAAGSIVFLFLLMLPAYIAHFQYAFRQKKLFAT